VAALCFNPRPRAGGDGKPSNPPQTGQGFQSTPPRGGRRHRSVPNWPC